MTKKKPEAPALKVGDVVTYHGRKVEIVEIARAKAPLSGSGVDVIRVKDPARGLRGMFRWKLEEGLGEKPEKVAFETKESFG